MFADFSLAYSFFTLSLSGLSNGFVSSISAFSAFFSEPSEAFLTASLTFSSVFFSAFKSSKVSLALFLAFSNLSVASSALFFLIVAISLKLETFFSALLVTSSSLSALAFFGSSSFLGSSFFIVAVTTGVESFSSLASSS